MGSKGRGRCRGLLTHFLSLSLYLSLSLSLSGKGSVSSFAGLMHSLSPYHPTASRETRKPPSFCLDLWARGCSFSLMFFPRTISFLPNTQSFQHSRPTEFHALSLPGTLYELFRQPTMPFPPFYASVLRNLLLQIPSCKSRFLDLPELCVPGMQREHSGETVISSQQR